MPATVDHTSVYLHCNQGQTPPVVTTQPSNNKNVSAEYEKAKAIFIQSGLPIVAQPPDIADKPKDFVNTSCVVIFLCNFVFGILGWHYGSKSNNAWVVGDINEARRHSKKALICVIAGIAIGICTYSLVFGLYFGLYVPSNR